MYRYNDKEQQDRDNFTEMYTMGRDFVMYNVPLYKIVVNRMKRFIKRKLYHLKKR